MSLGGKSDGQCLPHLLWRPSRSLEESLTKLSYENFCNRGFPKVHEGVPGERVTGNRSIAESHCLMPPCLWSLLDLFLWKIPCWASKTAYLTVCCFARYDPGLSPASTTVKEAMMTGLSQNKLALLGTARWHTWLSTHIIMHKDPGSSPCSPSVVGKLHKWWSGQVSLCRSLSPFLLKFSLSCHSFKNSYK